MASLSSRPKSASSPELEDCRRLLEHGVILDVPDERLVATAEALHRHGILAFRGTSFVRCVEPRDRDFPPPVRDCPGRIEVDDGLDEDGDACRCPECERPVYPHRFGKRTRSALVIELRPSGIMAFVAALGGDRFPAREIAPGVLQFQAGFFGVTVCLVDYCREPRFLDRGWAASQPCLYVAVAPAALARILPEDWLPRLTLAELLAGTVSLPDMVERIAARPRPGTLLNTVVPVYSPVALPIPDGPAGPAAKGRRFRVSLDTDGILVEDVLVVPARAAALMDVMLVLIERFASALTTGTGDAPPLMTIHDIADAVARRRNRPVDDIETIRRTINRLQSAIADQIRQELGLPVGRDDVVQSVRFRSRDAGFGYRLNPQTVALGAAVQDGASGR